jgi:tetratricopeptide (TPR) repeat protein
LIERKELKMLNRSKLIWVWCLWIAAGRGLGADSPEVERALELKKAGKTPEAIAVLEPFVAANPQDMRGHHVLAWLYQGQGNPEKAAEHFRQVIELAPDSPEARQDREALQRLDVAVPETPPKPKPEPKPDDLGKWQRLFAEDPAKAFAQARQRFKELQGKGDLEGLMGLLRVATAPALPDAAAQPEYFYQPLLEDLIDSALPLAQQAGQWAVLGELHTLRAYFAWKLACGGCWPAEVRFVKSMAAAEQAWARAGKQTPQFLALRDPFTRRQRQQPARLDQRAKWREEKLGPKFTPLIQALEEAVGQSQDAAAVGLMPGVLQELSTETDPEVYCYTAHCLAALLWLRGTEKVLPAFRQLVDQKGDPSPADGG